MILAERGQFTVSIPPLESYLDESSDQKKENIFCVGAILANNHHLKIMQDAWVECLKIPANIAYFRAAACKGIREPFFKLRDQYGRQARSVADKIRADLESILLSNHWIGFGIGIVISDYEDVWNSIPIARQIYQRDPVEAAFSQMFFEITRAVQENAPDHQVGFVVDDSTYSGQIAAVFKALKINHPSFSPSIATLTPMDDKITPPLQMADLIASIVKDVFIDWLSSGKPEHAPLELKWHNHFEIIGKWDKEHMLNSIAATLSDPRYSARELAERPVPAPTKAELRRREKQRRKALTKATRPKTS